jgi:division protein CdvB (Snf7/Vps24/ESCRT-III family)
MQMNQTMMSALSGATGVMSAANENMDVAQIRDTLKDFNKEMEKAGMKQEMMTDAMDMMEDPSAAQDADDVYAGILGEIGLQGSMQVGSGPSSNAIAS